MTRTTRLGRSKMALGICAALLAVASTGALAHELGHQPHHAADLPWSFEPWVLVCLGLSAGLYALGLMRLWGHAGRGRGVRPAQVAAFVGGWLTLFVALVSPVDPLGEHLFSAHMIQHELLMIVGAPLLVLGRPLAVWAWALPKPWSRAAGHFFHTPGWRVPWLIISGPFVAWTVHALVLWIWHAPALFDAALDNEGVHTFQHICFLLTSLVFWWSIFSAVTRKEQGLALVSLFTTMVHTGALGALMALSATVWYPRYIGTAPAFGMTALHDQQLGGLVMWVPAGVIYIVCGLVLMANWINGAGSSNAAALARYGLGRSSPSRWRTSRPEFALAPTDSPNSVGVSAPPCQWTAATVQSPETRVIRSTGS